MGVTAIPSSSFDDFGTKELYHLSAVLPDEVWKLVGEDESLFGEHLDQYARLDEAARRAVADEIVFYYAGTRVARELVDGLSKECDRCDECPECFLRRDIVDGGKSFEVLYVVKAAEAKDWTWYVIEATANVSSVDGLRAHQTAEGVWDEARLTLAEPRLRPYLLAPAFINEAADELLARIKDVTEGYARRRRRSAAHSRAWWR